MSESYLIRETPKSKTWEITKFSDYREPDSTYTVTERAGHYHCNCPGYWRQKNKDEHKHTQLVRFWREKLSEAEGYSLWFDGEDIEYFNFLLPNEKILQILNCSSD
jgi:hypothetical protein